MHYQNKNQANSINLEDSEHNSIYLKENKNVFPSSFIYLDYSKQNNFSFKGKGKGKEKESNEFKNLNLESSDNKTLNIKEESKEKHYNIERSDENYLYFKEKRKENQMTTNRTLDYYKQNSLYFKEKQKTKLNPSNQNQNIHHFIEESKKFEESEQNSLHFKGKQKMESIKKNPKERIGQNEFQQIVTHHFFQGSNVNSVINQKYSPPLTPNISGDPLANFESIYTNQGIEDFNASYDSGILDQIGDEFEDFKS